MATIAIIGDGPGRLSAALFIARAGHEVTVYGADETVMHYAFLNNYSRHTSYKWDRFFRPRLDSKS